VIKPLTRQLRLRSQPIVNLSYEDVKKMLQENDFFHTNWYWMGKGIQHDYKVIERQGNKLVVDQTTGLTWQQSGSKEMWFEDAQYHIQDLNKGTYGGYKDWRLPTLEEAMSLVEPARKNGKLYIDSVFDKTQSYIWTADKLDASGAWVVDFLSGSCFNHRVYSGVDYVRAVR